MSCLAVVTAAAGKVAGQPAPAPGPHTAHAADPIGAGSRPEELVRYALAANPRLAELRARAEAAWERVPQARALPDPMLATRVGDGMERITLTASQRVVSLRRLNAQARQAAAEAAALEQGWAAERLNLIAEVKAAYYRLYLIGQLLRINQTSQDLLRSLVKAAEAQVRGGAAGPGDVFRANLELARLGEESVNLRQELTSARADLNRLLNRPATAPLPLPESLEPPEQSWPLGTLVAVAVAQQPELQAARLRHEAALLGVRVARLAQVPELMLEAGWMYMNPDRNPPMTPPGPGLNAWMVGVGVSVPVWREKYRALRAEAAAETRAAAAGIEDLLRRYETMLADLLAQAEAARRTAELYDKTILPLARQTFETDRRAYQVPGGGVDFERVIENFRNLLAAEAAYHRAVARLATALARIEQAAGVPLEKVPAATPYSPPLIKGEMGGADSEELPPPKKRPPAKRDEKP